MSSTSDKTIAQIKQEVKELTEGVQRRKVEIEKMKKHVLKRKPTQS